jgi:hypothetical protein
MLPYSMDFLFKLGLAWVFLCYYSVYLQTKFHGYLIISLAAMGVLCAYLFPEPKIAMTIAQASLVAFWVGIAILGTFGRQIERQRLRESSWSQFIRGKVPESIRASELSERTQLAHGLLFLTLFSAIFYVAGRSFDALCFVVMIVVYILYFFSTSRDKTSGV